MDMRFHQLLRSPTASSYQIAAIVEFQAERALLKSDRISKSRSLPSDFRSAMYFANLTQRPRLRRLPGKQLHFQRQVVGGVSASRTLWSLFQLGKAEGHSIYATNGTAEQLFIGGKCAKTALLLY